MLVFGRGVISVLLTYRLELTIRLLQLHIYPQSVVFPDPLPLYLSVSKIVIISQFAILYTTIIVLCGNGE